MEFADLYNQSELKQINMEQLEAHMHDGAPVSPQLMQELAVSNETTNPFLWGVYILLKVSTHQGKRFPTNSAYAVNFFFMT